MLRVAALVCLAILLGACDKSADAPPPAPVALDPDATGHYCGMLVATHLGPKAQIILDDKQGRVFWFTSVRDAITFTLLPEEPKNIAAVYVTDAGAADWEHPEKSGIWIDANQATFVIESRRLGGMGKPEAIPFSDRAAATAFSGEHGGRLVSFSDIPRDYILN